MDETSYSFIRTLVREQAGIVLDEGKNYLLELRLVPLAMSLGHAGIDELLASLKSDPRGPLRYKVVEALTTNETLFFRDERAFAALKDRVIPDLLAKRSSLDRLDFWSAACSTGQEAYSIAMLLSTHFPQLMGKAHILGTDLSEKVLSKARQGRYSTLEVRRGLQPELLKRCFTQVGVDWQIREDLARMAEFRSINLTSAWPDIPLMDVVFLCNVLIYFDDPTRKLILEKIHRVLKPDGYLFLGGVENLLIVHGPFLPAGFPNVSCYRRSDVPVSRRAAAPPAAPVPAVRAEHEQRGSTRVRATFNAMIAIEGEPAIVGRTDDVSLGGLFLRCGRSAKVKSSCKVTLLLTGDVPGPRIEAQGTVVRSDETGIGVSFLQMSDESAAHLCRLVLLNARDGGRAESEISSHLGIRKKENG